MKEIDFYFDYLSPFSYFAWEKMKIYQNDFKFNYIPVPLGPILNHWGIKGPGEVEPKRIFLLKTCLRMAQKNNQPFTTPSVHPFNPLYALRMSLKSVCQEQQFKVIDLIWKLGWVERGDLGDPEVIVSYLSKNGIDGSTLYERSFLKESKQELKLNTQRALDHQVFGVPSFVIENELFWGQDSISDLLLFTEGKLGYDSNKLFDLIQSTPRGANQTL